MAQNKVTLSGKVIDQHGTPIAQATIAVENTTSGTYTDDRGKYSLQVAPGKHTFVVSFLGYQTVKQSLDIRQDKKQNFTLQESAVALNSVEVYGKTQTQKVKEGAFAVNALDIKPIVNSLNNLNDLVNRTTGIKVREEGGVGSDFDLSINGLSGNSIRYFLDGMPLDTKGSGVSLANLPINIIDRIEIYKGVVPASLGTDALGGAINIITKQEKKNYLDVSYGIGSFHTHKTDLNTQFVEKGTGLIVRPTVGINYSKNDYRMKNVQMRDESGDNFIYGNPKRFHDGYFSLLAQVEAGFVNKSWADAFFVSASYSKTDKELQTGSVQNKVYGMAERNSDSWNISARYQKYNFILKNMQLNASLSHTWDHSLTVDTAYRKYYWDGGYIVSQRNEIMGKEPSMRHYKRPLTIMRTNLDYQLNTHHSFNLNYHLSRTGNDRFDDLDTSFEPSKDVVTKHILGLSYNQSLLDGKMENVFFIKVRSYTHAWIDDNTLVIMSTNGKKDKILYTKLNAEDLTILAEGELNIPAPTNWLKLTSSGILTYRKSDNRLYYFYYWKETDGLTNIDQQEPNFHTAIINPSTMEVEKDVLSPIECEMAGSAYGELMQNCVMYDEADNLYLACFHEEDNAFFKGILLRINKGETEFDASYNGYPNADGKLLTIQYLEGNKALVYARNDNADRPAADKQPGIDAYSHYYAILDLTTGTKTRLSYDGKEIGYSGGRFSQRSVIFNNKAYIGVNTEEDANAVIYIYDIKTGNVEKGAEVDGRFYFDMIRVIEND